MLKHGYFFVKKNVPGTATTFSFEVRETRGEDIGAVLYARGKGDMNLNIDL